MPHHHHTNVPDAYGLLGLAQGASLEQVKSSYKKLAMTTHPDKNRDDPLATQKFQQLSEAYDTLVKHLDRPSRPAPRSPFGFGGGFGGADYDDYDDYDDDEYYDSEDDDDFFDLAFHLFLYEELLRGRASRFAGRQFHHQHPQSYPHPYTSSSPYMRRPPSPPPESDEQRQARLRREREAREQEAAKLAREEAARKARAQLEREEEMRAGAERRKKKKSKKKAAAAQSQASAAQAAQTLRERTQALRSEVFAAARRGDAARVKKGVWEESVDAAGPEQLGTTGQKGETLLHIAAGRGDLELLRWLDEHNAEADERDAHGYTAFHIALDRTLTPVVDYFLETYPPSQSESLAVYLPPPPGENLLELAMPDAQLVWAMLCSKLVSDKELAREAVDAPGATSEIRGMLAEWAGFSLSEAEDESSGQSSSEATPETSVEPESPVVPPAVLDETKQQEQQPRPQQYQHQRQPSQAGEQKPFAGRGRGRGRGRGQARGRGAQRGRGA